MWVLGPINAMTSSLNSLDQYNVLHMSSAQAICLNDCKLRRTRVDSQIQIIDQQPRTIGAMQGRIPKSTKQSTSWGVRVWYIERDSQDFSDMLGIEIDAFKNFLLLKGLLVDCNHNSHSKGCKTGGFCPIPPQLHRIATINNQNYRLSESKSHLSISYISCPWELWAYITHGIFVEGVANISCKVDIPYFAQELYTFCIV